MGKFCWWHHQTGVADDNEVINVSSHQTKVRDGTRTSPGENNHSCAFVIMQQVSEQGSAIRAHEETNTLLENAIANLNVHIVE